MSASDALAQSMTDGRVPFSEDDLATRFTAKHGDGLRYCHSWGFWLEWTGTRWGPDRTEQVFDLVREVCRHAATQCNTGGRKLAGAATASAVMRLARADRRHATASEAWDRYPYILNPMEGPKDDD